jgi:hypothetical protein
MKGLACLQQFIAELREAYQAEKKMRGKKTTFDKN